MYIYNEGCDLIPYKGKIQETAGICFLPKQIGWNEINSTMLIIIWDLFGTL